MSKCLFGTCSNNVAGYCRLHSKHMTVKQIRQKNCLGKECWHLQKNEEHEWWGQRERAKQKRKERKLSLYAKTGGVTI
jgi:hypothetical protein